MREFPAAQKFLQRILESEKEEGFFLFVGPEGAPLWKWAKDFFLSSACLKNTPRRFGGYCRTCKMCREISSHISPDLYLLIPEGGKIGIEQSQELQRMGSRKPFSRLYYVGIQRVEEMTSEAMNCLLKFLEEPPEGVVLVLTTHHPWRVPATILSRARKVPFYSKTSSQEWEQLSVVEKIYNGYPEWLEERGKEIEETIKQMLTYASEFLHTHTNPAELAQRIRPQIYPPLNDELLLLKIAVLRAILRDAYVSCQERSAEYFPSEHRRNLCHFPMSRELLCHRFCLLGELEQRIRSTAVNRSLTLMYTFSRWNNAGR